MPYNIICASWWTMNGEFKSLYRCIHLFIVFFPLWNLKNARRQNYYEKNEIRFYFTLPYVGKEPVRFGFFFEVNSFYLRIEVKRSKNVERTILNEEKNIFFGRHVVYLFSVIYQIRTHTWYSARNMTGIFGFCLTSSG